MAPTDGLHHGVTPIADHRVMASLVPRFSAPEYRGHDRSATADEETRTAIASAQPS
jgi:hypothetical protein